VFSAAADLDPLARSAYLDEACRHDPTLRAAVDSLLGAHDEAGSFGEAPLSPSTGGANRLTPGSQLGAFQIENLLGAGGMGEVYRAHDTKLRRAVAIKVLPDFLADDPDRRSRFGEEARALAALNHPHIGAIYGVEESGDVAALVLELVDGPTLSERLAAGPLPFDEVISIARQLADGLEAAHDRGIVHRDLKPANIKITPEGNVKILDFGLAKAAGAPAHAASLQLSGSGHATRVGVIVGTAGYMSPEQARGLPVDKRADIWAFGCVLFEMCALQPPFAGATVSGTLAAVIEREPDWALLRARTPPIVVRLLRRCLSKDPKLRLRDIGEARIALGPGQDAEGETPARPVKRLMIAAGVGTFALASLVAVVRYGPARPIASAPASPVRFLVSPPDGGGFILHPGQTFFAVSPDGSQLAFVASTEFGPSFFGRQGRRVWVRAMAALEARPLPGTDGAAASVFWSPDSRSLAFFADSKLKRIDLPDGAVVPICDLTPGPSWHGTWGTDGTILIGSGNGTAIYRVSAAGGAPAEIVTRNRSNREERVHWPWFLPDGNRFLYTARLEDGDGELRLGQLDGSTRPVMRASSNAQWVEPDIVVFVREGVLMGQRVDLEAARPVGEPFSIAERIEYFLTTSRAMFSVSRTGTVAFHTGGDLSQLVWADRNGNETGTIGDPADYELQSGRLSRDGTRVLVSRRQPGLGTYDIFRLDLVRQTEERLTAHRGSELTPVWVDRERAMIFASDSGGSVPHLFRRDFVTQEERQVLPSGSQQLVRDVFPDDSAVAYVERSRFEPFKLWSKSLTTSDPPLPMLTSGQSTFDMRLSPDGRAMAYATFNGPRVDLYVAPVPMTTQAVHTAGEGGPPRWSRDGHLYYLRGDKRMMTVPVRTAPSLTVGIPRQLFELKRAASLLEVSGDGRFLLLVPHVLAAERPIVVGTAAIQSAQQ
jgi:Tol biopolymer transport system component